MDLKAAMVEGVEGRWIQWAGTFINDSDHTLHLALARDREVIGTVLRLQPGHGLDHNAPLFYGFDRFLVLPPVTA